MANTAHRDGSWTIELMVPLSYANQSIDVIHLRAMDLDHVIRWGDNQIKSTLALLEDISGVPEGVLRKLKSDGVRGDLERVFTVFASMMPPLIKMDFESGAKPMATPVEAPILAEGEERLTTTLANPQPDPVDPRFPKAQGPVHRFTDHPPKSAPQPATPKDEGVGVDLSAPGGVQRVA